MNIARPFSDSIISFIFLVVYFSLNWTTDN